LDRKVICTGNKWWWGTHRSYKEGEFCRFWCWMWVLGRCIESRNYHSVQAYTFRRYKSAPKKCWLHTSFQLNICKVRALYSTLRTCAHSWVLHTKEIAHNTTAVSFIGSCPTYCLPCYSICNSNYSHVNYSVCSQLCTFFCQFVERKKVTEINKALGVCRINIYHSLDNVLHCIYHAIWFVIQITVSQSCWVQGM
jgi:hypothetical protein